MKKLIVCVLAIAAMGTCTVFAQVPAKAEQKNEQKAKPARNQQRKL